MMEKDVAKFKADKMTFKEFAEKHLLSYQVREIKERAAMIAVKIETREKIGDAPDDVQRYYKHYQTYQMLSGRGLDRKAEPHYEKAIEALGEMSTHSMIMYFGYAQIESGMWLPDLLPNASISKEEALKQAVSDFYDPPIISDNFIPMDKLQEKLKRIRSSNREF